MLKFIPHAVFEVPHSIPYWGTPAFHPTLNNFVNLLSSSYLDVIYIGL